MISPSDEAALAWFFGPGAALYERSTLGAILAKLARDSATSETCRRCHGAGILDGDGGFTLTDACEFCSGSGRARNGRTLCAACKGFGCASAPRRKQVERGGWCPSCSGTGATPVEEGKRRRTPCSVCSAPYDLSGKRRARTRRAGCSHCLGTGEEPISVKQMHKAQEGSGIQADETALTHYASVSRRVQQVRRTSAVLADALAAWYGPKGQQRAEDGESRGPLLYALTAAGRDYLQALEDQHSESLAELRERADESSAELYMLACQVWDTPVRAARAKRDIVRLAQAVERSGHGALGAQLRKVAA